MDVDQWGISTWWAQVIWRHCHRRLLAQCQMCQELAYISIPLMRAAKCLWHISDLSSVPPCVGTGEGRVWRQPADLPARLPMHHQASVSPSQQLRLGPQRLSADSKGSKWIRVMTLWSYRLRDSFVFVWHTETNCCACHMSWEERWAYS